MNTKEKTKGAVCVEAYAMKLFCHQCGFTTAIVPRAEKRRLLRMERSCCSSQIGFDGFLVNR